MTLVKLKSIQEGRISRIYKMVEKLESVDIKLDPKDVFNLAGKGSVGRLHLGQAILKSGKVKNLREAVRMFSSMTPRSLKERNRILTGMSETLRKHTLWKNQFFQKAYEQMHL